MNETNIQNKQKGNSTTIFKFLISGIIIILGMFINQHSVAIADIEDNMQNIQDTYLNNIFLNNKQNIIDNNIEQKEIELYSFSCINLIDELIKNKEKEELLSNSIKKYVSSNTGLNIRNKEWNIIDTIPFNSEVVVLKENFTEDDKFDLILYKDNNEEFYAYINNQYLSLEKNIIDKITQKNKTVNNNFSNNGKISLGYFSSTAYCNCSKCCGKWSGGPTASGAYPQAGRTIAVDPNIISLGTKVLINGNIYIAEDTGSAIKGKKIDIYFDSHSAALNYGRRNIEVFLM